MNYYKAPLPFTGQKRFFLKAFLQRLNEMIKDDGEGVTIIDVFGGSGLLSHHAKRLKPKARVIYNDLQGYSQNIKNIDRINAMRAEIYEIIKDAPRKSQLSDTMREQINPILDKYKDVDPTFAKVFLLFSSNCQAVESTLEAVKKETWYPRCQGVDYKADGYLDGLEICSLDFRDCINRYKDIPNKLLILDPPYLFSQQKNYIATFNLADFLELLELTAPPFIFFSHEASDCLPVMNYLADKGDSRFQGLTVFRLATTMSSKRKYVDLMISKGSVNV